MNLPDKKYQIIYADPPWSYYNDMTVMPDCTTVKGMRRPPYPVMSSSDIKNLPIQKISEDDCILFIWTTDYHLEKCMEIVKCWGFEYKTVGFVWQKLNKQGNPVCFMGAYTMKSGVEICLIATKGKNAHKMVEKHNIRSLIQSPRLHHSKKPDEVRKRIEELVGNKSKIELFARDRFDGWDCWGNQI
jgi:site-specific DNA-methyltransferase (adenine-specific)